MSTADQRYNRSAKGKARYQRYNHSEKGLKYKREWKMRKYDSDPIWRVGTALKRRRKMALASVDKRRERNEAERAEFRRFLEKTSAR